MSSTQSVSIPITRAIHCDHCRIEFPYFTMFAVMGDARHAEVTARLWLKNPQMIRCPYCGRIPSDGVARHRTTHVTGFIVAAGAFALLAAVLVGVGLLAVAKESSWLSTGAQATGRLVEMGLLVLVALLLAAASAYVAWWYSRRWDPNREERVTRFLFADAEGRARVDEIAKELERLVEVQSARGTVSVCWSECGALASIRSLPSEPWVVKRIVPPLMLAIQGELSRRRENQVPVDIDIATPDRAVFEDALMAVTPILGVYFQGKARFFSHRTRRSHTCGTAVDLDLAAYVDWWNRNQSVLDRLP